jgi:hypothetical protein
MNFDDIKAAWNNDSDDRVEVPASVTRLKSLRLPVEKLRRKMRYEFNIQFISLVIIGVLPIRYFKPILIVPYYALYFVVVVISVYYFSRFYIFYKSLSSNTLRSKDNLYALYYEARLNIEMYRSYTYTLIPFMVICMVMGMECRTVDPKMQQTMLDAILMRQSAVISLVPRFILMLLFMMGLTEMKIRYSYMPHLEQIKKVLDEFKENE